MTHGRESAPDEIVDGLGAELLRIHQQSYGASAGQVRVHILADAVVCFLDDLQLMPSEQFLIGAGRSQAVIELRNEYQQAIEMTFRAAVERATGRRVVSFVSATKLGPNYAVEIFRLGPHTASLPDEPVSDGRPGSTR
ncbi:MAG: DUF2294 family protein [Solirubrobacterales bacterium]|nr:DUF2294 family protein [Solirubrobacterales bacterium]